MLPALLLLTPGPSAGNTFDDVFISYELMQITEAWVAGERKEPTVYRHNTGVQFGRGPWRVGGIYQRAIDQKDDATFSEDGAMLTTGYDWVINERFHFDLSGRVGLTDTDESTVYYAADTDATAKLIWYDADGAGLFLGRPFYPSAYGGTTVSRYGRVQAIGGIGVWHNECNLYLTAFHALNGVTDPFNPGDDFDIRFAHLKNSAVTFNAGYEIGDYRISFKKNFPFENSGNDLHLGLEYRHFFDATWGEW